MKTLPISITAGIEATINRLAALDPDFVSSLESIQNTIIAIELTDVDLCVYLVIGNDNKIRVMTRYDNDVDVRVIGTSIALSRMGLSDNPNAVVLSGDVVIEGDVDTARKVQELMASLNIDWEEQLSKVAGDIVAHQVGNAFKNIVDWGRQSINTLSTDASEYVKYEKQYVPTNHEVKKYIADVDTIRNDIDRMEARVQQLVANNNK